MPLSLPSLPTIPKMLATGKVILFGICIMIMVAAGAYLKGRSDGKTSIRLANERAINKAITLDRESSERRAAERTRDALNQAKVEKAYADAIASAPGGANSPAARALACERLRRAYPGADLPAGC